MPSPIRLVSSRLSIEKVLWTLGVALLLFFAGGRALGEVERRQALLAFAASKPALVIEAARDGRRIEAGPSPTKTAGDPTRHEWSPARVRDHAESLLAYGSMPVGVLRIPRVALEVPVFADLSERNLNRGAGLVDAGAGADSTGNLAIAAHRDGYFRALRRVAVGDVIELESASQHRRYRIEALSIVDPSDLSPLRSSTGPVLTLITCYPFWFVGNAPQRFIVRAVALQ